MVWPARFISAARRYWIGTYPTVRREIAGLSRRASAIPDPTLRRLALHTQRHKRGNLEGAAAFAAFVPSRQRRAVVRLLVGMQAIYDYADTLMEQPNDDPSANARVLHCAMLTALDPAGRHCDYYRLYPLREDGGYLQWMVDRCRLSLAALPTFEVVAAGARRNTQRIIDYQTCINLDAARGFPLLVRWASRETPHGSGLHWWETAAACGSSLAVLALLAAATDPALTPSRAQAIEDLYWPWAGALHTLLDNLVDRAEDERDDQHNLTSHYSSVAEMSARMRLLTQASLDRTAGLPFHHRLIFTGMAALYLADRQAWTNVAAPASAQILAAIGGPGTAALAVLRLRDRL